MFANIWNRIITWFEDRSERNRLIREFNKNARDSWVRGEVPTMLTASISRGESSYKHQWSRMTYSGFRIKASTGIQLSRDELIFIGNVILSNVILVRRMIVLGWDTLEVHGEVGNFGCRWRLIDYANMGVLPGSN